MSDDLYVSRERKVFVQSTVMYAKVPDEALAKRHDTPGSSRGSYDGSIVTTQMLFNRLKALARVRLPNSERHLEDVVPSDLVYREQVAETYGFLSNPKHLW